MAAQVAALTSCFSPPPKRPGDLRQRTLLDADWRFHRGEISNSNEVTSATFDDRDWQPVNLPHDYVLDGSYSYSTNRWVRGHGYLPYDVGWYRKRLFIPQSAAGKILRLDFDGSYRESEVWLNGQFLGLHKSGYTPFSFDVSQLAKSGAENILTVRVDPSEWEGWWYEGGGIYRHVYLTELSPIHVAQWGTYVISKVPNGDQGADAEADLTIQTTIENSRPGATACEVDSEIIAPDGTSIQKVKSPQTPVAGGQHNIVQRTVIQKPALWSLQSPNLFRLRTTVVQDGKPVDSTTTTFGIRTIRFDADKGFFLNGRHVEIQGVANHQDFPGVGIAVPDSLQPWRVEQLKKMGCNGWRTAHNPPNESLLDACDQLGMLVMDENRHLGDSYDHHSPPGATTATNLSDLATMIQRDRNHPSIIMWSMCNEEKMQGTAEGAGIFSKMMDVVHRYDDTRPITSAMNGGWLKYGDGDVEDIIGLNYGLNHYDAMHNRLPAKAMFGSEDTNQKTTRGQYANDPSNGMSSCYSLSEQAWLGVVNRQYLCGSYTWTGFDYKGEPNPYGWPDVANNTGLMDSCGFPKDKYYYFESCWSDKPMVHLLPDSWNWPGREGKIIRVIAFSNARQVELLLNGRSLGVRKLARDSHVEWKVPYQPGRLTAKAYNGEKLTATEVLETTGAPAHIELSPDRRTLHSDGEDAVVVPVSILDAKGRVVPDAASRVSFELSGGGRILGVGNGNPADHDSDRASERNAFHGRCIVILQAGAQPASLRLTATSPGLASATTTFTVQ
ncbi:MAG TPA: beta-galactosidase GalA [Verrucomicrobiae bacterium]|nr:beta-galactosidase GalA [Verrucomicrobiae bacterium]